MSTKKLTLTFVVLILNFHLIYSKSEDYEFPNIDYTYISNDNNELYICDQNSNKLALNTKREDMPVVVTVSNNNDLQDINRKLELLEKSFNISIQTTANDIVTRQTSEIQTMVSDIVTRQTSMIQAIANLTSVVQMMSEKNAKLENRSIECQTQLQNCTAAVPQTNNKGNETSSVRRECEADPSDCRLLHVTVPSSVRARTDVWKYYGIPDKDDLDMYMVNVTGCQYMAGGYGGWQSVSNSPARGTWRRRLAVRGEGAADIRVKWGAGHDYGFYIGTNSNTETKVYDNIQSKLLLQRATPGVMSLDKYTQFYFIQLEDGVMSFGALGESTPWLRHDVTVSAGDVVRMEYGTGTFYGVKLLVCE